MTSFEPGDGDETFKVSAHPETVGRSAEFEGANVCRVTALPTRFSDNRLAMEPLAAEFRELGFSNQLISTGRPWRNTDPLQTFVDLLTGQDEDYDVRTQAWVRSTSLSDPKTP